MDNSPNLCRVVSNPHLITKTKLYNNNINNKSKIHYPIKNRRRNKNKINDIILKIKKFQFIRFYWINIKLK
jgi:hypothetical protein